MLRICTYVSGLKTTTSRYVDSQIRAPNDKNLTETSLQIEPEDGAQEPCNVIGDVSDAPDAA